MDSLQILYAAAGLVLGAGVILVYQFLTIGGANSKAQTIINDAQREAESKSKEAELKTKELLLNEKTNVEKEFNKTRDQLRDQERQHDKRQITLDQLADDLKKQERIVESTQQRLASKLESANLREKELNEILERQRKQLQHITGLSREDAEKRLLSIIEDSLAKEVGARIVKHEKLIEETCEEKSREMLLLTMQRFAAVYTSESTTSTVDIPNDEMKGRIIGREGRNIRAFEKETGVDVIIDDTPGVVIVSGFDPIRREVARQSLEKLITDGRIHPTRIEEIVSETQKEMEAFIHKKGVEAAQEIDIHGLHDRIIRYLGRLYFRTSYSQNVLSHSLEVAFIAGMLAELIGLDPVVARRCGLLHDLGKAADHEREGGHPQIGAEILKQCNESAEVVHAALGHHDDIVIDHPYTVLVATADACSASRPGARRESLERYIKRMEELESIAREFKEVQQAFAIQAGRELRVLVSSNETDDSSAAKICRDIATAFEERLTYPGEIKVTVVRESRFTELAR